MLAAEPGSAVRIVLLFPDGDDLLDPLDRVAAGLERGVAVRRGNADDDARLPDRERADTVDYGDVVDAPSLADLVANLRQVSSAAGAYASYSRWVTARPRPWSRTVPMNVAMAPAPG